MGILSEAVRQGAPNDDTKRCGVCRWAATLDDSDREALQELILDAVAQRNGWNISKAHEVCERAGLEIKYGRFCAHAKKHVNG